MDCFARPGVGCLPKAIAHYYYCFGTYNQRIYIHVFLPGDVIVKFPIK